MQPLAQVLKEKVPDWEGHPLRLRIANAAVLCITRAQVDIVLSPRPDEPVLYESVSDCV